MSGPGRLSARARVCEPEGERCPVEVERDVTKAIGAECAEARDENLSLVVVEGAPELAREEVG